MGRHKLYYERPKVVRDALNAADDVAKEIHRHERELIRKLVRIDKKRHFVRFGFRTLGGFCRHWLKFSRTQAQRLVNQVRRYDPLKDPDLIQRVQPTAPIVEELCADIYDGIYVHGHEVFRDSGESHDEGENSDEE